MSDRHSFRAEWHDYNNGVYFVTICCHNKLHKFGEIVGYTMNLSALGQIVDENIKSIPSHYDDVELWNYVVMPNHLHIVIAVGTRFFASAASMSEEPNYGCIKPPRHGDGVEDNHHNSRLASIVGAFKAGVTRTARTRKIASLPCWQKRFHEHIIRNQTAFENIMYYIDNNVVNWGSDCFHG